MNVRLPNIHGSTAQQLAQIKSYLQQLAGELNYAANAPVNAGADAYIAPNTPAVGTTPQSRFNEIKALIIKSADIVDSFCQEVSRRLEGKYAAQSDFGTFTEETAAQITANATAIDQNYTQVQQILTDVQQSLVDVSAYIRTGLLYTDDQGAGVYGMEIGQRTGLDGQQAFRRFARFTADKLAFYDQNGVEAAYISDGQLRIPKARVEQFFALGGYEDTVGADGSVTTRWVGT